MSIYMFIASNKPLDYFTNTEKIELDTDKPLLKVDRIYSFYEPQAISISSEDYPELVEFRKFYTNKKYSTEICFRYSDEVAKIIIQYIEKQLEVTKEIELWSTSLDEWTPMEDSKIKKCNLDDLTIEHIKDIWAPNFYTPQCLKVYSDSCLEVYSKSYSNPYQKKRGYKTPYWE